MDKITQSFVSEFVVENELTKLDEAQQFEAFAGYCVVSRLFDDEFDPDELRIGGENDLAIDAACLIVNGNMVQTEEELQDLLDRNKSLEATIVIVQAKRSASFDGAKISDLADNLCDVMSVSPTLPMSSELLDFKHLLDALYARSSAFRRRQPELVLRYVTTGTWMDDPHLTAKMAAAADRLAALNLFDVDYKCLGAREVQQLYRQAKNSVEASFEFRERVPLPPLEDVEQSYIGVARVKDYLQLITDDAGNIRKSLFYDNVRDFQDYNPVNTEIRSTLADPTARDRFVVLNNGVTIVARELTLAGNRFTLRDYQIVNGCQTSHVLFDARDDVGESVFIPLRLIATQNEDLASSITTATNRQTNVTDDDLRALDAFQKKLEDYFAAQPIGQRLYYERRSRQYATINVPEKTRIVSPPQLIRAYSSMFLDEPWRAGRYYKELQKLRAKDIFRDGDSPEPYYASATAAYKIDFLFRNQYLPVRYKPARYQLLTALRHLIQGPDPAPRTGKKCEQYCSLITSQLWDGTKGPRLVKSLLPVIDDAVAKVDTRGILDRDTVRTQQFTDAVMAGVAALRAK